MVADSVIRGVTHLISRAVGMAAALPLPPGLRNVLLRSFGTLYGVNWDELDRQLGEYRSFQQFFTRNLPAGVRPLAVGENLLRSPVDGAVHSVVGIHAGELYQIKGRTYSLEQFLGPWSEAANELEGGQAATLYLRPKDYHHIHMPTQATVEAVCYIPGTLWPVNPWANRNVTHLYSRNERLGFRLRSDFGTWYLHMVGALCVGGMESVIVNRPKERMDKVLQNPVTLQAGDQLGQFLFGSTVVLLFPPDCRMIFAVKAEDEVRVGSLLATVKKEKP